MPAGRIDDDDVEPFPLELCDALRSDRDGIGFGVGTEVCNLGFGSRLSGLVEGTSTKGVSTYYRRFEAPFLVIDGELCAGCGFTVTLRDRQGIVDGGSRRNRRTCKPTAIMMFD